MFGSNFTSRFTAALYSWTVFEEPCGVHVLHAVDQLFERIRAHLGRAAHLVFVAQQMQHLRVEHLPGVAAGLREHGAAVFGVGVIAEIRALIDEALAVGVDHDAERIAVPIAGAVLAIDVAVIVGVALPGDRVAPDHCP